MMQATANVRGMDWAKPDLAKASAPNRRAAKRSLLAGAGDSSGKIPAVATSIHRETPSEAEAIQRAQAGDKAMFEYLYRLHSGRVYATCLRMLGNPADAEDLTQEAFLLLFRKIHTFRGESAFSTWLHRLAINLVLMHFRRKPLPTVTIEEIRDPDKESYSPSIDPGATDPLLEGSIDRINLQRCIAQLPAGYRTVFILHDIQGYGHQEIGDILGRSEGVSKSQLHRARKRLRQLLHELQREKFRGERVAAQKTLCQAAD